ncbi:alpha-tocopherol transfer protein-like [Zophobas morio]|uniref:alpha-tocopherol transfer protein-like n=1 Tax=Zophobas morio TaxID=2755281 RepID=UPI003083B916
MESSSNLFEVRDDILQLVLNELNYSSINSFHEDVRKIREWMMKQPHLPEVMADKKIENFLILNKGSVERCKEKIENYYSVRTHLTEIFENINPKLPYMDYTLKAMYLVPLPKLTKNMYRVFYHKIRDAPLTANFDYNYAVRLVVNIQELRLTEDVAYGDVFIIDGQNTPPSLVFKVKLTTLYNALVVIYKKVFSNRMKALYLINAPSSVEWILTVIKSVIKPKLFERIHVCENWNTVFEQIGEEILPRDCGGKEKSLEELQDTLRQEFNKHQEYFNQLDALRVNEELRPQRLKNSNMFGFSGNFKKLDID